MNLRFVNEKCGVEGAGEERGGVLKTDDRRDRFGGGRINAAEADGQVRKGRAAKRVKPEVCGAREGSSQR